AAAAPASSSSLLKGRICPAPSPLTEQPGAREPPELLPQPCHRERSRPLQLSWFGLWSQPGRAQRQDAAAQRLVAALPWGHSSLQQLQPSPAGTGFSGSGSPWGRDLRGAAGELCARLGAPAGPAERGTHRSP
uniref:Uncharacterized protein n=1 Tax=Serinus canaria TaxID=9135 RepID=A0A8C9NMY6_SERCA